MEFLRVSARSGPNDVGNVMPKAFAPALVAVSLTGLVVIKDVGPGATMADTGEEEEVAMIPCRDRVARRSRRESLE